MSNITPNNAHEEQTTPEEAPDVRGFYGALGVAIPAHVGPDVTVACFAQPWAHGNDDTRPSCSVNLTTGLWKCHGCEAAGNAYQAAIACERTPVETDRLMATHRLPRTWGSVAAIYDYLDEDGSLLYQVVRFEGKEFRQRRPEPDGSGEWLWNVRDVQRVPYRLPELIEAVTAAETIWVVEGEKDAESVRLAGATATCNSGGAGKWEPAFAEHLVGARVVIVADRDPKGTEHAFEIMDSLNEVAVSVEIVQAGEGKDATDHLSAGHGLEEFEPLPDDLSDYDAEQSTADAPVAATAVPTSPADAAADGSPDDGDRAESASGRLLRLARASGIDLFHDTDSRGFASFTPNGHSETWSLESGQFKRHLRYLYYREHGTGLPSQALTDALGTLEGQALFAGEERPVALRLAEHRGVIYLDLGDPQWTVIEISATGWRIVPDPPVRFRRSAGTAALPHPEPGGSVEELRRFLNLGSEENWQLIIGWLLGALSPAGRPYPVLALHGEQGSSKSTIARILRALIDPSGAPLRSLPSNERDLMIEANASWMLCFDNASGLRAWLSDAFCRLATGGGYATRQLYTDQEQMIIDVQRPIVINGIEELVTRSDLLDRTLLIQLPRITSSQRRAEAELWAEFHTAQPRILGALLDTVAAALANLNNTHLDELPRMADFALWVSAAEPALGWEPGTFLDACTSNRQRADQIALDASAIGRCLLHAANTGFDGSATELLDELRALATDEELKLIGWPKTAQKLSGQINRLAPNLRALGHQLDVGRTNEGSRIRITRP